MVLFSIQMRKEDTSDKSDELGVPIVSSTHWADGGAGAKELAETVVDTIENADNNFKYLYDDNVDLWTKMETIAKKSMEHHRFQHLAMLKNKLMNYKQMAMEVTQFA